MQSVVFMAAHADDMELGAGGTCALLCQAGYDIRVVVVTDDADPAIAGQRRREAVRGATILGVHASHVHFLGQRDGFVTCNRETVTALRALVQGFGKKPLAVFTHSDADSHQDHVATSKLTRAAFREAGIFKYFVRNSGVLSSFAPSVFCKVDAVLAKKEAAICAHASQDLVNRIPLDKVRAMSRRFGSRKGGGYCEPFELEVQNEAPSLVELLRVIDAAPFTRLWSPLLGMAPLTILAGHNMVASTGRSGMTELMFLTRLQARLMSTVEAKLGDEPMSYIDVRHAMGSGNEALAERGHVLVIGTRDNNSAVESLFDWIGVAKPDRRGRRNQKVTHSAGSGLLTIAANPFARRAGRSGFLIGATGPDQASSLAAALILLDDDKIATVLDRAEDVFAGRAPAIHIEVPLTAEKRSKLAPRTTVSKTNVIRFSAKKA